MLAEQFEVGGGHVAESVLVGQFLVAFLKLVFGERMRWRNFTGDFTGQLYQHGHVGFGIFLTLSQLAFTSGSGGVFFLLLLELGMEIGQLALQRDDFGGFIIGTSFLVPSAPGGLESLLNLSIVTAEVGRAESDVCPMRREVIHIKGRVFSAGDIFAATFGNSAASVVDIEAVEANGGDGFPVRLDAEEVHSLTEPDGFSYSDLRKVSRAIDEELGEEKDEPQTHGNTEEEQKACDVDGIAADKELVDSIDAGWHGKAKSAQDKRRHRQKADKMERRWGKAVMLVLEFWHGVLTGW